MRLVRSALTDHRTKGTHAPAATQHVTERRARPARDRVAISPLGKNSRTMVFLRVRHQSHVDGTSRQLVLPPARGIRTVLVSSAASFVPAADVEHEAFGLLENASTTKDVYNDLRTTHTAWWSDFWSRTFVHLTSDDGVAQFMSRLRTFHLYYMASSSRGELPAKWNGSLFSVNGDQRNWGAPFWVWTTEISHHPLYAADASDLGDPYFDMYAAQLPSARIAAR